MCEGQLTYFECFKVLSTFNNNKTPGNDGLTVEFYKFFWPQIGLTCLIIIILYIVELYLLSWRVSNSQKQTVITLIEKRDKDRRWIKKLETDFCSKSM